jgi:hypothetical protein
MVLSIFGISQEGNNNRVRIDDSDSVNVRVVDRSSSAASATRYSEAVRNGTAYTGATPSVALPEGRYLNVVFTNPTGSGKTCHFVARKMGSNLPEGRRPSLYGFVLGPVWPAGANPSPVTGNNRLTGSPASAMEMRFDVNLDRIDTDPAQAVPAQGFLPNGGQLLNVDDDNPDATRIVGDGQSFGFYIQGQPWREGEDAARMVFTWYEEDV